MKCEPLRASARKVNLGHSVSSWRRAHARRDDAGAWLPATSPEALTRAVHDNLRNLGLDVLDVVNLRIMFGVHGPAEGSIEEPRKLPQ